VKIPDCRFRNWHSLFAALPSRLILLLFQQPLLCGMMIALMTVKHTDRKLPQVRDMAHRRGWAPGGMKEKAKHDRRGKSRKKEVQNNGRP
jgi:hypothetical protein